VQVLLLHGFAGGPQAWDRVVATLAQDARSLDLEITAFELAGHGETSIDGVLTFEDEVSRLERLVERLPRPRLIAGYSLGGRLALGLLVRRASSFAGALLIGVHGGLEDAERADRRQADAGWAELIAGQGVAAFEQAWCELPLFASQARLDVSVLVAQRAQRLRHDAQGLAGAMRALSLAEMPNYARQLDAIDAVEIPVVLMAGALDVKFCQHGERLASRLRAARTMVVAGAGHNLPLEAPAAVAAALAELAARIESREVARGGVSP
jgi:2-succinyl-6-hydroxy-2,4-cyclohexadiene-1-carboxylate synthase